MRKDSPTVKRRQLSNTLRELREEQGISKEAAARHVDHDTSWLNRAENADLAVRPDDVSKLLRLYGIKDQTEIEAVLSVARGARKLGWWQRRYGKDALPTWFVKYIGLERGSTRIRLAQSQMIHGLFQTPEYAYAMLAGRSGPLNPALIHERVAIRMERQAILHGEDPTPVSMVLDESALHRRIGSPEVMVKQLRHLVDMSERSNIQLQILPFDAGIASELTFAILNFPRLAGLPSHLDADDQMVYVGVHTEALYLEEPAEIASFASLWENLRGEALSCDASRTLLATMAERGFGT